MASGLALSSANVDVGGGVSHQKVSVEIRGNRAKLRKRGQVLAEPEAVVEAVVPNGRRQWSVQFADGSVWQVTRQGCGCGGGR